MRMVEATHEHLSDWKQMRQALYRDVNNAVHDKEIELILSAPDATCFLGYSGSGFAIAMLELTLRNYVDGCLGGPVGYIEGIYLAPDRRGTGNGRRLVEFAAEWFRSKGCRDMAADAEIADAAAQEFLLRTGFEETYRIVEFRRSLDGN